MNLPEKHPRNRHRIQEMRQNIAKETAIITNKAGG